MALQITFTDSVNITYINSYHNIYINRFVAQDKTLDILIRPFKDLATRTEDLSKFISFRQYSISPTAAHFDTYIGETILKELNKSLISQVYAFLKTVDPQELDSPYADFAFDYKNDSTDV